MTSAPSDAKLLLVDDLEENLVALEALVRGPGRQVFTARTGDHALDLMLAHEFALAVLDVQMPGMTGFELAELMRGATRTRHIPIVFVTAAGHEMDYAFRGYESGAVDVLHKPLDPHAVRGKTQVFVDLFRQRQTLQSTQAQLERAVRMRDDFMSMASHELRTPLNTLFLQAQLRHKLVEAGNTDLPTMRRMVERDERQIRSMIRLIDDMLDVSRLRTGRLAMVPVATDLAVLVRRVADSFAEQAQASGSVITVDAPASMPAVCDEFRIEQVVTNLLTNAMRYGGGGAIAVSLAKEGPAGVLRVKDKGVGIAPEHQQRIFEQFERADGEGRAQGLGLGLFITRQIVQAHGGDISVESAPGQGSEFSVTMPLEGGSVESPR